MTRVVVRITFIGLKLLTLGSIEMGHFLIKEKKHAVYAMDYLGSQ